LLYHQLQLRLPLLLIPLLRLILLLLMVLPTHPLLIALLLCIPLLLSIPLLLLHVLLRCASSRRRPALCQHIKQCHAALPVHTVPSSAMQHPIL
jgi:hypothetical protein